MSLRLRNLPTSHLTCGKLRRATQGRKLMAQRWSLLCRDASLTGYLHLVSRANESPVPGLLMNLVRSMHSICFRSDSRHTSKLAAATVPTFFHPWRQLMVNSAFTSGSMTSEGSHHVGDSGVVVPKQKTLYKRELPTPPATAFSSPEGRLLFQEALLDGTMAGFFKIMEQFSTQDEPAFCGLASLSMVLNALAIDPRRKWKGVWRWFHEELLDCCSPIDTVKQQGITLGQAACLARCNGARVEQRLHGSFTEAELRDRIADVCSRGEEHIVVSYNRQTFKQTGDGHFSPVGGYHRQKDLVLILDVARFKYPPHWVPLSMLFEAMSYIDLATGLPRGYLLLSSHPLLSSAMFTLDIKHDGWKLVKAYLNDMPQQLEQCLGQADAQRLGVSDGSGGSVVTAAAAVRHLVAGLPLANVKQFLVAREHSGPNCRPRMSCEALLGELRDMPLHKMVSDALESQCGSEASDPLTCSSNPVEDFLAERVTLLLLLQPFPAWPDSCRGSLASEWQALQDLKHQTIVATEVAYLRQQFEYVDEVLQVGTAEKSCGQPACTNVLDCAGLGHGD